MDAVVDQIGQAICNAALHSEVLDLNQTLEQKVLNRTRQLEESRAALIGQDRLATLGRLVAAIAHELNNPVGAMASFAQTIEQLVAPVMGVGERLKSLLSGPEQEVMARQLLDATLSSAVGKPLDTRSRRKLTDELRVVLAEAGIASPEEAARRLARLGLSSDKVRGSIDLIRDHDHQLVALLEQVHTFGRGVATIRDCSSGVARIVEGLKTYAHLDQASVEEADLHRGIEAALAVLQSQIPADVQVETHFDNIGPFPHRPGELTQVWTNLIDNAVRAMGERGRLLIETRDLGETVRVTVEDSGPGIPSGLRDTIFDLHATTRGPGAGLGLGLPICRAIVERNHGGQIDFESVPGRTAFTVTIPKTPAREQETTK